MNRQRFLQVVSQTRCQAKGCEDAGNDAHRAVLAALLTAIENPETSVLCEPSLARSTTRPADIAVVCPIAGVHVIEVKGVDLADIERLEAGGQFAIQYASGATSRNPFAQVRNAMFDIKDAAQRIAVEQLDLPFQYWVMLARISRHAWRQRWGEYCLEPPELLFADDVPGLADRIQRAGLERLEGAGLSQWPADQLSAVMLAFGDSSVLYTSARERKPRRVQDSTLGAMFDEAAESHRSLSDEQQRLSIQNWDKGPRLIRGVAGSGKTIVLANNLARRLQRERAQSPTLPGQTRKLRIAAVCFNRTMAPFLRKKIEVAWQQRTATSLPKDAVHVFAYNRLMWHLSQAGLWRYQRTPKGRANTEATARAMAEQYLRDLEHARTNTPELFDSLAFDAIYVDEGQDLLDLDIRILMSLCRENAAGEPNLYIFYDDAQNLYGKPRPHWQSLGLKITGGRSHVMTECFRNTRQIVESAFNVLYGTLAEARQSVPTREFGDIATLRQRELLEQVDGIWKTRFAPRSGMLPRLTLASSVEDENQQLLTRLQWLMEDQEVRPQDILIITHNRKRVISLTDLLETADLRGVKSVHNNIREKDRHLIQRGELTVSTVHSAKGYDAYCVLLVSANDFRSDVSGRAAFYVACTRAIEYLEIFSAKASPLFREMKRAVAAAGGGEAD